LEEQLHHSQKMDAIGRLAGGIAHDFNNLLTAINGYADLALDRASLDPGTRELIAEVLKAGKQAAALTRQLLAFGRRQVIERKRLDLNAIVESNAKILRRVIGEDVNLVTTLQAGLNSVKVDAGQIEQILMNLAVNARDAMPQGGKLTIETQNIRLDKSYADRHISVAPGDYVMIAVSDTGCGMDLATQSRIFEPFFTTKELGKGTGLGLSIVYAIVKQNEGDIWVYSEPGHGSSFKIYFPQILEEDELKPVSEMKVVFKPSRGSETILVVEDDARVRELICAVLQNEGYKTLSSQNGREAIDVCESQGSDIGLVITDTVMPEMSGPALVAHLIEKLPGIRFLQMSGYVDEAVLRHGYLDSGALFIQKPFRAADLLKRVREILDSPITETSSNPPNTIPAHGDCA
jgi:nitrogen fixation/metabolism regulation signal transduction histidine kinase